jgi:hypothetical protein
MGHAMAEDSQNLPRSYAVLTRMIGDEARAADAGRAWYSLALLGACVAFWTIIVLIAY